MFIKPAYSLLQMMQVEWKVDPLHHLAPGDVSVAVCIFTLKNQKDWLAQKLSNAIHDFWLYRNPYETDAYFHGVSKDSLETIQQFWDNRQRADQYSNAEYLVRSAANYYQFERERVISESLVAHLSCGATVPIDDTTPNRMDLRDVRRIEQEIKGAEVVCYGMYAEEIVNAFGFVTDQVQTWHSARF